MEYRSLTYLFLLLFSSSIFADIAGITIGGAVWSHQPSGDMAYGKSSLATDIDFDDTLDLSTESEGFFWLSIEHPLPLFPNLKLQATQLSSEGSNFVTQSVRFGDTSYPVNTVLDSKVSLDQMDAIFYYELLDNLFSLDLGVNVKVIDAEFSIASDVMEEKASVTLFVPMLYAAARFDLPLTGAYLGGSGSIIGYQGHSFSDYQLNLGYESVIGLGVEGGYRVQALKIDNIDDIDADVRFSGAYLGLFYHF